MKTYEAMVIFPSQMKDEDVERAVESFRKDVERVGGETVASRVIGRRQFARSLAKRENGVYARFELRLEPSAVTSLKGRIKLNENVFRAQILAVEHEELVAREARAERAAAQAAAAGDSDTRGYRDNRGYRDDRGYHDD